MVLKFKAGESDKIMSRKIMEGKKVALLLDGIGLTKEEANKEFSRLCGAKESIIDNIFFCKQQGLHISDFRIFKALTVQ